MAEPCNASAKQIAANRRNAQKSTGPRTNSGKEESKMNALKHGRNSKLWWESLEALGEDPDEFQCEYEELRSACDSSDPFWASQLRDLAELYCELKREKRLQNAIRQRELELLESQRLRLVREVESDTYEEVRHPAGLRGPQVEDSPSKFKQTLAYLDDMLEELDEGDFEGYKHFLFTLYGDQCGGRAARIKELFEECADEDGGSHNHEEALTELRQLLLKEKGEVAEAYELFKREYSEVTPAERAARLAPAGAHWALSLQRESALRSAIDRKVKIIMTYVREAPLWTAVAGSRPDPAVAGSREEVASTEPASTSEVDSGQTDRNHS